MKAIKWMITGALVMASFAPAMAQDNKAKIDAVAAMIKSKPADLKDQLKDAYKENRKNEEVLVGIGRVLLEQKDTANATMFAEYAIKRNKEYGPAFLLMGDIEAEKGDGGKAAGYYNQAIYFDPKNPDAYYKYATVYRKISPTEAVAKLEELRVQRPDVSVDALIGHTFYASNEFDKAIESYAKMDRNAMADKDLTEYAMALYFKQRYQESLDIAKVGLSKLPRDAAYNRLAFFNLTDMKDYTNALVYADALFNKSDSAKFSYFDYTYYGNALAGNKQHKEAIEMYKKALEQDIDVKEKRAGVIKQLAEGYAENQDFDNAIKTHQEYMAFIDKPAPSDYVDLAQLYIQSCDSLQGEPRMAALKNAENTYVTLAEKFPDAQEYAIFWRARVNSYMDPETEQGLAKPYYEQLAAIIEPREEKSKSDNARLVECYRYLGYYSLMQNDKETADTFWNKILVIDPENETAKKALSIQE